MTPYYADEWLAVHLGDNREVMAQMPAESVDCVVTSPPYWGLRDYGAPGQLGLEPTPEAYVAAMVGVFREVRRVLRSDGTLWLNLGDSYANHGKWGGTTGGKHVEALHGVVRREPPEREVTAKVVDNLRAGGASAELIEYAERHIDKPRGLGRDKRSTGLKPKDLVGIPWRVAFALQADGWYLRSDIIWAKPNPMPESVTDRPTKSHEYLFLLTKSPRYHFDADAVREGMAGYERKGGTATYTAGGATTNGVGSRTLHQMSPTGRNIRSVWTIATRPYPGAHFATFPEALVKPTILAGCRPGGVVLDPFAGSGTVAVVAQRLGRKAVLIDLSAEYVAQAMKRIGAARSAGDGPAVDMPVAFADDGLWA